MASGPPHVLAAIKLKYWIVQGLSAVCRELAKCMNCREWSAHTGEQIMVAPFDPLFTQVGVDYCGPLFVKQGKSEVKRYGCLFTCLTMRAVYIEIAHTLEADSSSARISVFSVKEESPRQYTAIMAPTLLARNES